MDILNEQILRTKELMGIITEQDVLGDYRWEGVKTYEWDDDTPFADLGKYSKIIILTLNLVDSTGKVIQSVVLKVDGKFGATSEDKVYSKLVKSAEKWMSADNTEYGITGLSNEELGYKALAGEQGLPPSLPIPALQDFKQVEGPDKPEDSEGSIEK